MQCTNYVKSHNKSTARLIAIALYFPELVHLSLPEIDLSQSRITLPRSLKLDQGAINARSQLNRG